MGTGAQKETPRQKMIGMMYLFYTALLALQVSNSVLDRFIFINKSLERQIQESNVKNGQIVMRISDAVEERGNREGDQQILVTAKEVREETQRIIKYCRDLKEEMVDITGGYDEQGNIIGIKDQDKVANLMINKDKGEELKSTLNEYSKFLEEKSGKEFPDIALDGKDNPVFKDDRNQRVKNFSVLTFENTPTAAGIASVSQLMTEVMFYESEALETLAQEVGAGEVKFDKILVMAKPESKYVAAGTDYEADLFLAASSSAVDPEMFVDGEPINIEEGFGKVKFKATASSFDNQGQASRTYLAEINYNDSLYREEIEYIVVRPTLQIISDAVNALYLNCGNPLNVQCPQLGSQFSPSYSANGARVLPSPSDRTSITVVPSAPNVTLNVSSGGVFIGARKFPVRRVPNPTIDLLNEQNRVIDEAAGVSGLPRVISLKINPDPDFANALPQEARYRATRWRITLATGPQAKARQEVTGGNMNFNLSSWRSRARPGDRVVIEIMEVQRANFQNEPEKVAMGTVTKQFIIR